MKSRMSIVLILLLKALATATSESMIGKTLVERDFSSGKQEDFGGLPVLRFCCERNHYFDMENRTCVDSGQPLDPSFHTKDRELIDFASVKFTHISEMNTCQSYLMPGSEFFILPNGQMMLKGKKNLSFDYEAALQNETLLSNEHYCLLWLEKGDKHEVSALVCFPEDNEASLYSRVVHTYILPISMGISAFFLALTFFFYCLVGELRDLLGKSLMCSVASLCLSKVFGIVVKSFSSQLSLNHCVTMAILMHFGFLIAFFWLNVISFILFITICFQRKVSSCSRKKWFASGCAYAFGVPLLILALVLIHDFTPHLDNDAVPKPGFGVGSCGFTNRGAQVVYFYAPIAILIGINLVLFCISACRLFILSKQTSAFVFQFNHYLKLFVLMGIPWIFEVLSFFFNQDEISIASFIWLLFDIFNALQGLIIFIVFACRKAVLARVSETLCGIEYARVKYPNEFLQHANEETNDAFLNDMKLTSAESKERYIAHPSL